MGTKLGGGTKYAINVQKITSRRKNYKQVHGKHINISTINFPKNPQKGYENLERLHSPKIIEALTENLYHLSKQWTPSTGPALNIWGSTANI